MLNTAERMQRILAAPQKTLARIDEILTGEDTTPAPVEKENRLVTYAEAARRTGLSRVTIYRLVRNGRLDVVPLSGVNRITLQSVNDLVAGNRPADDSTTRKIENTRRRRAEIMNANRRQRKGKGVEA